jgi:SNF2 family DNA or RNA helicase
MGLGKTIQSIAIIALVESLKKPKEIQDRHSHHIVIVPKVTLGKWLKEIRQWVPSLRVFQFYGNC